MFQDMQEKISKKINKYNKIKNNLLQYVLLACKLTSHMDHILNTIYYVILNIYILIYHTHNLRCCAAVFCYRLLPLRLQPLATPPVIFPTSVNISSTAPGIFGSWLPCWWPPVTMPLTCTAMHPELHRAGRSHNQRS